MSTTVYNLSTQQGMDRFMREVADRQNDDQDIFGKILEADRTLRQNNFINTMYRDIAVQLGDRSEREVRWECKLNIGLPILRPEDPVFNGFCAKALGHLTHEQRLKSMEYIDVTSRMSVKQAQRYIDQVIITYTEQGVALAYEQDY